MKVNNELKKLKKERQLLEAELAKIQLMHSFINDKLQTLEQELKASVQWRQDFNVKIDRLVKPQLFKESSKVETVRFAQSESELHKIFQKNMKVVKSNKPTR